MLRASYTAPDLLPVNPEQHRDIIVATYEAGLIDYWEAWKQLYNAGWRRIVLKAR